jgi:hypothetical protein
LVFEAPRVRGLSFSFDYFKLNQNKVIENIGAAAAIDRDEIILDLATQAELAKGTAIGQIDLGSGTAGYKGSSKVVRLPVTAADRAAFDAYNALQTSNNSRRAPVGEVASVIDDYLNLSGRDIQGYEFGLQYRMPKTRLGQFTFNSEATHYVLRRSKADENSPILDELERNGRTKWRANASLTWRQGGLSAGWFSSYFGSFVDTSAATTEQIYRVLGYPDYIRNFNDNGITRYLLRVDPSFSHNAWLSYRFDKGARAWLRGVTVRGGINNVLDREPQLADEQYGYFSGSANPRGRQFTLDFSRKF